MIKAWYVHLLAIISIYVDYRLNIISERSAGRATGVTGRPG